MIRYLIVTGAFLCAGMANAQLSASELLEKAIAFHDPQQHWQEFKGEFNVRMETPKSSDRKSTIAIDFSRRFFELKVSKDTDSYTYRFKGNDCETSLNGSTEVTDEDRERLRLHCNRGRMMQDYYTYLYGLPMKLKDPGTRLAEKVERKTFKGKTYLTLKVTYDAEVGDDTWYFYFDPDTYAMEVYQFFHDESKNDGEYILLDGLKEVSGIKMPRTRAWYYNSDDTYLGTDILD
ncbi:MAG: hypothetical protein HRT65_02025 [Flavobacteriaceae bacterium]|nr:hypothetical protein [Flavobacteriaceae bacterium]